MQESPAGTRVRIGSDWRTVSLAATDGSGRLSATIDGRRHDIVVVARSGGMALYVDGVTYNIDTQRPPRSRRAGGDNGEADQFSDGVWSLPSPLTGAVVDIRVKPGDMVEAGDVLVVVEAMKMQNDLRSRVAGRVLNVLAERGQRVELGAPLVQVEQAPGAGA